MQRNLTPQEELNQQLVQLCSNNLLYLHQLIEKVEELLELGADPKLVDLTALRERIIRGTCDEDGWISHARGSYMTQISQLSSTYNIPEQPVSLAELNQLPQPCNSDNSKEIQFNQLSGQESGSQVPMMNPFFTSVELLDVAVSKSNFERGTEYFEDHSVSNSQFTFFEKTQTKTIEEPNISSSISKFRKPSFEDYLRNIEADEVCNRAIAEEKLSGFLNKIGCLTRSDDDNYIFNFTIEPSYEVLEKDLKRLAKIGVEAKLTTAHSSRNFRIPVKLKYKGLLADLLMKLNSAHIPIANKNNYSNN